MTIHELDGPEGSFSRIREGSLSAGASPIPVLRDGKNAATHQEAAMTIQNELDLWPRDPAPVPALVTVKDAGRILSVSRSTVYQLISSGRLEVVHIRRSVRVPSTPSPPTWLGSGRSRTRERPKGRRPHKSVLACGHPPARFSVRRCPAMLSGRGHSVTP
jgi:excisionase family DNA binding protein